MSEARRGRIYTFYSYKGGVGRSMALANVAALMVRAGQRVLAVDWDLEAPGLEHFLGEPPATLVKKGIIPRDHNRKPIRGSTRDQPGVVDMLEAWAAGRRFDWRSGLLRAEVFGRRLDLMSAGMRTDDYQLRVSNLNWTRLFEEADIGRQLNQLRDEWVREYDAVLIDSRTGVTDIGDICTVILPDVLVLLFISNLQNIEGVRYMMRRAATAHAKLPVDRARLVGVPVPGRDEAANEYEKSQAWKKVYEEELGGLYEAWLPRGVTPQLALNKLFIPYVTNWSFGERLPVVERPEEIENPASISAAYDRLSRLLISGLDLEQAIGPVKREEPLPRRWDYALGARFASIGLLVAAILALAVLPVRRTDVDIIGTTAGTLMAVTDIGTLQFDQVAAVRGSGFLVDDTASGASCAPCDFEFVLDGAATVTVSTAPRDPRRATAAPGAMDTSWIRIDPDPTGWAIGFTTGDTLDLAVEASLRNSEPLLLDGRALGPGELLRIRMVGATSGTDEDLMLTAQIASLESRAVTDFIARASGATSVQGAADAPGTAAELDLAALGLPYETVAVQDDAVLDVSGLDGSAEILGVPGDPIRFRVRGSARHIEYGEDVMAPRSLLTVLFLGAPLATLLVLIGWVLLSLHAVAARSILLASRALFRQS